LTGFDFTEAAVVFPPLQDGTNIKGTVILPNPSYVTFELGNVTLNMIVGGLIIGQGRIDNIVLKPGNNTVPIRATLAISKALQNLPTIIGSQVNALKNGNLEVSASGNSTIYNGQHIDYYEKVLNGLVVTGQVPIIQILLDSAKEFLGSDTGNLLTGFLGGLNLTNVFGALDGLTGNSSTSSNSNTSSNMGILGGFLGQLGGGPSKRTLDTLSEFLDRLRNSSSATNPEVMSNFTKAFNVFSKTSTKKRNTSVLSTLLGGNGHSDVFTNLLGGVRSSFDVIDTAFLSKILNNFRATTLESSIENREANTSPTVFDKIGLGIQKLNEREDSQRKIESILKEISNKRESFSSRIPRKTRDPAANLLKGIAGIAKVKQLQSR